MDDARFSVVLPQLLWTLVFPTGAALLIGLIFQFGLGKKIAQKSWPAAFAVLAAFLVGYVGVFGPKFFAFAETLHWLPLLGAAAFFTFALDETFHFPGKVRALLKLALLGLLIWPLLAPLEHDHFQRSLWIGGLGVVSLLIWHLFDRASVSADPAKILVALMVMTVGTAATLLISHSASVAQLGGGLGCGLGVCFAFRIWKKQIGFGPYAIPVPLLLLLAFLGNGYFYADVSTPSAILLLIAFAGIWLCKIPFFATKGGIKAWILLAAALAIPCAAAVALSFPGGESF